MRKVALTVNARAVTASVEPAPISRIFSAMDFI